MKSNTPGAVERLIRDARPELDDGDVTTLAGQIRSLITGFVASSAEPVTYVVLHWRDWVSNKRARSGYTPGRHRFGPFLADDPQVAEIRKASGSLCEGIVWTGTTPDTPEDLQTLEAAADRAGSVHARCRSISDHGHALFLKRFWPDADPHHDLVADAPPEKVIKALSRADARELALEWARHELHGLTRPDTAFVLTALARMNTQTREKLTGPAAAAMATEALQLWRSVDGTDFPENLLLELFGGADASVAS